MKVIDLNADVGEGAGNDAWLVPLVTSVNIACGAHAGDARTMRETLALAAEHHVVAGAHPGFADRAQMGRRDLDLTRPELIELVTNQLAALHEYGEFHYVKPHGALYTMAARDAAIAEAIAVAVKQFDATLVLMGLAGSQLVQAGREAGLRVVQEMPRVSCSREGSQGRS
jgi:5-oxoprolinase (ATP-hydrolysing) subunit A